VDEKKMKYNELVKRLNRGIDFFEDPNIEQTKKDENIKRWSELKLQMSILLDEIGEIPKGGCLNEFE
jgi:hypothetical protein